MFPVQTNKTVFIPAIKPVKLAVGGVERQPRKFAVFF
jgi:hypothetical protein